MWKKVSPLTFLVTVTKKARKITVKGPRGTVTKDFSHVALDIQLVDMQTGKMQGKYARIQMWNAGYKQACAVTTIKSLISNMIIGVTEVSINKRVAETRRITINI